ncbi:hypothetical protein OEZ86_010316 [Tetradesmus obliquus]|nr:hypothetical protein OEZ86_010316 [Tetradesmus obliquus]
MNEKDAVAVDRPVAALLLLRCFQQWGVLTAENAPVLDQLACLLPQQLSLEDESAPAEVAGLQCHVAYWLTVSAVLLCLLLKTTNPQLAAAAAVQNRAGGGRTIAGEVMTAARRRVGELQQQLADRRSFMLLRDQLKRRLAPLLSDCMVHPGLTTLGGPDSSGLVGPDSSLTGQAGLRAGPDSLGLTGQAGLTAGPDSLMHQPDSSSSSSSSSSNGSSRLSSGRDSPRSPPAGAAVAGAAAASAAEAEAALLCYRSWSEVVGVMHAAVVALRGAGVPRALTAALVQQVLEFINCQLFNQLLLRPECCSAANAAYVLRGLKQLDGWLLAEHSAADGDIGWEQVPADSGEIDSWQPPQQQQQQQQQQQSRVRLWQWQQQEQQQQGPLLQHDIGPEAWDALSHIRQALQFLVLSHKGSLSLDELAGQVCPALSHQQLYRLCTTAWDEAPGQDRCVSVAIICCRGSCSLAFQELLQPSPSMHGAKQ